MNKALVTSSKVKKIIVSVIFALYLMQLVANVGLASQYSFYQYASQGVAVGLYISIVFTPLVFLIAYMALRRRVTPRFELFYQSALWSLVSLFLLSFVIVLLRYLVEPYVDMSAWREFASPSVTIAIILGLLGYYLRGGHTQALLNKIIVSTALLYLATLAIRPFLAIYRAFMYVNSGGSDIIFDLIFATFPMVYHNFAPLVFILLLTLIGYVLVRVGSVRRRSFNIIVSCAIAVLTAETIQQFGNFFISDSNNNPFYISIHVVSYAIATGVFLSSVRFLQKSKD
ncbi:MAG: hypothetical protein HZB75_03250 [Candidatus Saccharibacteria bacterium]|nr:MAG: hypothetical protein HZB75_03250 [Candidatus Saccharibacteria bacterium]